MVKVCPICRKSFTGKAGLKQHMLSQHASNAPKPVISTGRRKKQRNVGNISSQNVNRGVDVLTSLTVKSGTKAGTILMVKPFGPQSFKNTRLNAEARLFARWLPSALKLTAIGAGASTTYGSVLVGWVADPTYQVQTGSHSVNVVGAMKPHVIVKLNGSSVMNIPTVASRLWYDCDGAVPEDIYHGTLVATAASDCGGWLGNLTITLTLDWAVRFNSPELPIDISESVNIHPDAGWYKIFTTSYSTWDSGRLTFKMTSGGAMVPFSAAQPGVVYGPSSGTKVYYKKEDGNQGQCSYFTLVQGFETPGLVLHATHADAKDYITSGDISKVLPYYGAGDYTVPDHPMFQPVAGVSGSAEEQIQELREQVRLLREQLKNQSFRRRDSSEDASYRRSCNKHPKEPDLKSEDSFEVTSLDFQSSK